MQKLSQSPGIDQVAHSKTSLTSRPEQLERAQIERAQKLLQNARDYQWEQWHFKQCGLQGRWVAVCFEDEKDGLLRGFRRGLAPKAYDALRTFDPTLGKSLLLRSDNYGVGKTHLVAALVNQLLDATPPAYFEEDSLHILFNPCPVFFTTEIRLLTRIRQTFNHSVDTKTEENIFEALRSTPLLIIDDVGKTKPRDYSFLQSVYFRVIDQRYTDESPVILTTNLTLDELEQHIGGASADRLREMCGKNGFISISGKSYRR